MSFIEKLQNKSKNTRVLILWLATFLVMIVIVAIWLFSFSKTLNTTEAGDDLEKTNIPSLFESIGNDFSTFKEQLQSDISDLNNLGEQVASE